MDKRHETTAADMARTYGSGSFKKRTWKNKDGEKKTRWNGYVYASDGSLKYGSGKTQKEAEKAANAARDKHERSLQAPALPAPTPPAIPTFGAMLFAYNDHRRKQKRADSTLNKYSDYAADWASIDPEDGKGPLGARLLPDVTFTELELAIAILHERHGVKGRNTVRNKQAYVAGALRRAYLLRLIERAEGALLTSIPRKTKTELDFDPKDLSALCREAKPDASMTAALALGSYGLRIGEVCGATADDLVGNVLTLSRQLDRVDEDGEHGPQGTPRPKGARLMKKGGTCLSLTKLKSDAAQRKIVLDDHAAKLLMAALDGAKPDTLWDAVEKRWVTKLFIVRAPRGGAQETQRLRARFSELCKSAGVERATFHLQRALFATSEAREGTPLKVLSAALGHTSAYITEMYIRSLLGTDSAMWAGAGRRLQEAMAEAGAE